MYLKAFYGETVYQAPDITAAKVSDIFAGNEVEVLGERNGFYKIGIFTGLQRGGSGYVYKWVFNDTQKENLDSLPIKGSEGLIFCETCHSIPSVETMNPRVCSKCHNYWILKKVKTYKIDINNWFPTAAVSKGVLYQDASLKSDGIYEIQPGDLLNVTGQAGRFYRVNLKRTYDSFIIGFVEESVLYIVPKPVISKAASKVNFKIKRSIVSFSGNVYSSADRSSSVKSNVFEGEKVTILEESGEYCYIKKESNGNITGYVEKDLFGFTRATISNKGNMYSKPDINSPAVCEVFSGDKVIIADETFEYYHIKLESNRSISGYVVKGLVAINNEKNEPIEENSLISSITSKEVVSDPKVIPTDLSSNSRRRIVNRPGLLSFVGYFYAVIGWIGIIGGAIGLITSCVGGFNNSGRGGEYIAVTGIIISLVALFSGGIFAGTGNGVLKGSGAARVFATILSLLFIPTVLFFVLFMIGLFNRDANDYFNYCRDNQT